MTSKKWISSWWWVQTNVKSTKLESFSLNFIRKWGSFDVLIIPLFCLRFFFLLSPLHFVALFSREGHGVEEKYQNHDRRVLQSLIPIQPSDNISCSSIISYSSDAFVRFLHEQNFLFLIFIHYFVTLCMGVMSSWSMINNATRTNGCINNERASGETMNVNERKNWKELKKKWTFINFKTGVWFHLIPNK